MKNYTFTKDGKKVSVPAHIVQEIIKLAEVMPIQTAYRLGTLTNSYGLGGRNEYKVQLGEWLVSLAYVHGSFDAVTYIKFIGQEWPTNWR